MFFLEIFLSGQNHAIIPVCRRSRNMLYVSMYHIRRRLFTLNQKLPVSFVYSDEVEADPYYYGKVHYGKVHYGKGHYPGYYYGKKIYKSYYPSPYYGKGIYKSYYGKKWGKKHGKHGGKYGYGHKKYYYPY